MKYIIIQEFTIFQVINVYLQNPITRQRNMGLLSLSIKKIKSDHKKILCLYFRNQDKGNAVCHLKERFNCTVKILVRLLIIY